jgi:aldehyde:ferredoxin oxidoreductase
MLNYWGTEDRWGFGALFGQRKLKGVAMRGMGLLEIKGEDDFIQACAGTLNEFKGGPAAGKKGVADISAAMGEDITSWIAPILHRDSACYNTSYPTNTFLKFDEDPKAMKESDIAEPGVMITNIYDILGFKKMGLPVADAGRALQACLKQGIDPAAAAELCQKAGKTALGDIKGALAGLSGNPEGTGKGTLTPYMPAKALFYSDGSGAEWRDRRIATALIMGIQPVFSLMSPFLSDDKLIELANLGTDLGLTTDALKKAVGAVLAG